MLRNVDLRNDRMRNFRWRRLNVGAQLCNQADFRRPVPLIDHPEVAFFTSVVFSWPIKRRFPLWIKSPFTCCRPNVAKRRPLRWQYEKLPATPIECWSTTLPSNGLWKARSIRPPRRTTYCSSSAYCSQSCYSRETPREPATCPRTRRVTSIARPLPTTSCSNCSNRLREGKLAEEKKSQILTFVSFRSFFKNFFPSFLIKMPSYKFLHLFLEFEFNFGNTICKLSSKELE